MLKKITVFGLGTIGASIAMAIKAHGKDFRVTGADPERSVEDNAMKKGYVDKSALNIHEAAEDADLVILALPVNRTRETLVSLGKDLKEETVVLDCCPDKSAAAAWARLSMAHPENYLGILPGINPTFMFETAGCAQDASADLFRGAVMQIGSEVETTERAINAAAELAAILDMECSFIDPPELDGMLAGTEQLPFLLGCGLIHTCANRPGWRDAQQITGKRFAAVTSVLEEETDAENCAAVLMNNRENAIRLLNEMTVALEHYRDALEKNDEAELHQLIDGDLAEHRCWMKVCRKSGGAESDPALPRVSAADVFSQTFFGGLLRKQKRN